MSRAALLLAVAAGLLSGYAASCSSDTAEPPPQTYVPLTSSSASPSASVTPPSARVVLPATSGAPVVVPPTVRGVLPVGFADSVCPEGAPVRVALITNGATPRRALRYAFKVGAHKVTELQVRPEIGIEQPEPTSVNLPALGLRVDLSVARREPAKRGGGDEILLAGRFVDVRFVSGMPDDADPRPLEQAIATIRKQGFELDVDDHGRQRAFRAVGEDPSDPTPTQLIEQMRQGLGALVVPLPDEEIGLGATWQSVARVPGRTEIVQFTTWTLKSLSGDVFEVESRAELFAVKDEFQLPGGAGKAKLAAFSSSGAGATTSALDDIGPRSGRWDVNAAVEVASPSGAMKMSSKIHFEMSRDSETKK